MDVSPHCHCIPWFLKRRATGFNIPNLEGHYAYQIIGAFDAQRTFSLRPLAEDLTPLSSAEKAVLSLYTHLFRPFNNIPDAHNSEWINFGFCFCTTRHQKKSLAAAYLKLAKSGASLGEVAYAWATSSLSQLMKTWNIDISFLEANGICFQRPDADEFGIYRLVVEVSHTLSGRFCNCFRPRGHCHIRYDPHLSVESNGDYGFHGTNAWERWQLLNFYNHIFMHPNFNARKMQQARRHTNNDALEQYLDLLIPNFRSKIGNMYLGDAMFPKLRGRIDFPHGRLKCYCVVHNTVASEGLDWRSPRRARGFLPEQGIERGEEKATNGSGCINEEFASNKC